MKNNKALATLGIISVVLMWGVSFLCIKVSVVVVQPMTLGFIRFFIASILLALIVKIKCPNEKLEKKDVKYMMAAGFIGVTLYFYFENNGVKLLPASSASLIIALIPIFTLIFDTIFFKTRITLVHGISVIVSLIGVYLLVDISFKDLFVSKSGKGYLMMFGAIFSWVVYCITTKPVFDKYSQTFIVYYQSLFGTILFFPFALFEKNLWSQINMNIVLNILYLSIFCSAIGFVVYVYSMKHLGVFTTSLYLNIMPVVTCVSSYIILKEAIYKNQIIGGIFIIVSVYLSSWQEYRLNKKILNKEQNIS
ncbi:DMT family transporter [Abyssisolibacter fermentans]|uniref:DMT family transporter n=1 Tax=Abyssisolibacter fermentans TaxID=1766203 RepID=UPI00082A1600|nr:DMT family transporter [Abyssisolibacter fermentans]